MKTSTCRKIIVSLIALLVMVSGAISGSAGAVLDFDGDGRTDPAVIRRIDSKMNWFIDRSNNGFYTTQWGTSSSGEVFFVDFPACEDYDGDGKWDIAVFRNHYTVETQTYFFIYLSETNTFRIVPWGLRSDVPVPQDYDGDGVADIAVYRRTGSELIWYILQSRDGLRIEHWGLADDVGVSGDYDGDGKADLAVARRDLSTPNSDFTFYIRNSLNGTWKVEKFGYARADTPVPGDYDGDGKTDIAVWRGAAEFGNGVWYWHRSSDGAYEQVKWGIQLDLAVQGDYDGDGKTDPAVWRFQSQFPPVQQYFYILQSRDGPLYHPWGLSTDGPVQGF